MGYRKIIDTTARTSRAEIANEELDFTKFRRPEFTRRSILSVDPDLIAKKYHLKGFTFGNFVTQEERYFYLFLIQGQMKALAQIAGTENLGLGKLIIGFGADGKPGSAAYFDPRTLFINLNRGSRETYTDMFQGENSFLHEYAHFLDYHVGRESEYYLNWASNSQSLKFDDSRPKGLPVQYGEIYERAINIPEYFADIKESDYLISPWEVFARVFEQCITYHVLDGPKALEMYRPFFDGLKYSGDPIYLNAGTAEDDFVDPVVKLLRGTLAGSKAPGSTTADPEKKKAGKKGKAKTPSSGQSKKKAEKPKPMIQPVDGVYYGRIVEHKAHKDQKAVLHYYVRGMSEDLKWIGALVEVAPKLKMKILGNEQYFNEDLTVGKVTVTGFKAPPSWRRTMIGDIPIMDVLHYSGATWRSFPEVDPVLDPGNKATMAILDKFTSDDSLRPVMNYVYFDQHGATATDAHQLIHLAGSPNRDMLYSKDGVAMETVLKESKFGRYPNYESVIPGSENAKHVLDLNPARLFNYLNILAKGYAWSPVTRLVYLIVDDRPVPFNGKFLMGCCEAMMKLGGDWKMFYSEPNRATVFAKNKEYHRVDDDIILLMPIQELERPDVVTSFRATDDRVILGAYDVNHNQARIGAELVRLWSDEEKKLLTTSPEVMVSLSDAVLYRDETWYYTLKKGVPGIGSMAQGAWGTDFPFIPIEKLEPGEVTTMTGKPVRFKDATMKGQGSTTVVAKGGDLDPDRPKVTGYKLGDGYKSDFDFDGMIEYANKKISQKSSIGVLEKMHHSLEDNNYHDLAGPLWKVIVAKKSNDSIAEPWKAWRGALKEYVQ